MEAAGSGRRSRRRQRERMVGRSRPGRMADQQQHGARRRLFQHLQQGVLGVAVHILRAIDDDDAPAALRGRQPQEGDRIADIVDDDLAAQLAGLGIDRPRQDPQIRMAAAGDAPEDGMLRDRVSSPAGGGASNERIGLAGFAGQQESGEAIGERRLADALGARSAARHGPAGPSGRSPGARARRAPARPAPDSPAAPSGDLEAEPRLHRRPHLGPGRGLVARWHR